MFFYSHCGRGFICLYGGRSKRCLKSSSLCGNLRNNFGPHKAPRRTWHIWTPPLASRPSLNTHGIGLLYQLICNMPSRRCPNPLRCFVFDSETAYELVSHAKPPLPFGKCAARHNSNNTVSTNRNLESLRNTWWKCFLPLPKNRYSAACSNAINFYDPNSPFHLPNARLN